MKRETLPDFSGVYADEFELRERAKEQGFGRAPRGRVD